MTVGERIKKRREECGLSVIELADRLGKARSTIYRYESDEIQDMPITVLEPIAKALRTTPAHLMGWAESSGNWTYDNFQDNALRDVLPKFINTFLVGWGAPILEAYQESSTEIQNAVCAVLGIKYIAPPEYSDFEEFIHRHGGEIINLLSNYSATKFSELSEADRSELQEYFERLDLALNTDAELTDDELRATLDPIIDALESGETDEGEVS